MTRYTFKQYDYGVSLQANITLPDGSPLDLNDPTITGIKFKMWIPRKPSNIIVQGDAEIVDPDNGLVRYTFREGQLGIKPGTYKAEFEVTMENAKISTETFWVEVVESA